MLAMHIISARLRSVNLNEMQDTFQKPNSELRELFNNKYAIYLTKGHRRFLTGGQTLGL